jgi:hypothetical protein
MRLLHALLFAAALRASTATAFSYFEYEIDYWKQKPTEPTPKTNAADDREKDAKPSPPSSSFDWKKHTDPKNDEFFREGDYVPPAPFMELVRNPTDENIKNWFEFIGKKNELSKRLNQRIQEYAAQSGAGLDGNARSIVQVQSTKEPASQPDYSRYRFRLYFHSGCPHCKRMMQSMTDLQARGYFVEIVQIDDNAQATRGLPFPVRRSEPGELESKDIRSWPVLLVGDLQKKVVYRINGYQTTTDILNSIRRS